VSLLEYDATVRDISASLTVAKGETVALLGPNGSGKSTVLQTIAGLNTPDSGRVVLDGQDLSGVPAHRRHVAMLAQDPLLFPHLSALDNVAFGPRVRRTPARSAREQAQKWLEQVDVEALGDRLPHQLSGGQAQRVAIARALATTPRLLLLDEPLAALDVNSAPAIRQLFSRVLANQSAIIVTHDVLDALLLADRVVVLEAGRVVEEGPTAAVLRQPRSALAAQIAGLNLVAGKWSSGALISEGMELHGLVEDQSPDEGAAAVAVFSPAAVSVYGEPPHGSPRNVLAAVVTEMEPLGERIRLRTLAKGLPITAEITPAAVADLALTPGDEVHLSIKATEITVYPAR
jgi:molybdate transport system ATP-binding protein